MSVFRIAQISDLHLATESGWFTPIDAGTPSEVLAAVYGTVFKKTSRRGRVLPNVFPSSFSQDVAIGLLRHLVPKLGTLDALLVTGDLATTGNDDDLRVAKEYFEGKVPADWNPWQKVGTAPALLRPDIPVITLPGNHDRYQGVRLLPGSRSFERFFSSNWDFGRQLAFQAPGSSNRVRMTTLVKAGRALVICLVDCTLGSVEEATGGWGYIGQGDVGRQVEADLEQTSAMAKEKLQQLELSGHIVWAVHFPPAYPDNLPVLELLQANTLIAAAQRCGVSAILAGHTHDAKTYKVASSPDVVVFCCGATTGLSKEDRFSFSHLEFDVSADRLGVSATNFVWSDDPSELDFVAEPYFPVYPPRPGIGVTTGPFVG